MTDATRPLIEVTIAAPIEAVWHALRDPAEVRRWFGWEHEGLDDEIRLIFVDEPEVSEHDRSLRWSHGDQFTLLARGDATVVRVTRAAPADGSDWSGIYDDIDEGWVAFVQQLRFALERHPGQDRRTLFLSGDAVEPGPPLSGRLGLDQALAAGDGKPYAVTGGPGEALTGQAWFRSANVAGVTVDGYGDGLLVVVDRDEAKRPPHGGGTVTITTYGLDDAAFERLRQRWTTWWADHYTEPKPNQADQADQA